MGPDGPVHPHGAPTPSCAMHFEWPAEADGPVRPFIERALLFIMQSERPTGTDDLGGPPGRRALSPEYPSSIADALRREQAIYRRVLTAKRRRDEQPPAYEEVVSYAQAPPFSRPGERPAEAAGQLWRPPTRISSPEPDRRSDSWSQRSCRLTRSPAGSSNSSRGRSPTPPVVSDAEPVNRGSTAPQGVGRGRLFARLLR